MMVALFCGLLAFLVQEPRCEEAISEGSYVLVSFDGDTVTVTLTHEIWGRRLWIRSGQGDSIVVEECGRLIDAKVIDERFLVLHTSEGRGNLVHEEGYHLICAFRDHLQTALLSKAKYWHYEAAWECGYDKDPDTDDYYLLEWAYALSKVEEQYSLKIHQRYSVTSKCILEKNQETLDSQIVNFDGQFGVFCNGIDTISGKFGAFRLNDSGPWKTRKGVVCPYIEVDLGTRRYFVDGSWCIESEPGRYLCGLGRDIYYDQ